MRCANWAQMAFSSGVSDSRPSQKGKMMNAIDDNKNFQTEFFAQIRKDDGRVGQLQLAIDDQLRQMRQRQFFKLI